MLWSQSLQNRHFQLYDGQFVNCVQYQLRSDREFWTKNYLISCRETAWYYQVWLSESYLSWLKKFSTWRKYNFRSFEITAFGKLIFQFTQIQRMVENFYYYFWIRIVKLSKKDLIKSQFLKKKFETFLFFFRILCLNSNFERF